MSEYCVYMHKTPNGKVYIGITSLNPLERWRNGSGYYNNHHFRNAIKKYGWDNIEHLIISTGLDKEAACTLEKELINQYDSTNCNKGYNHSTGGEFPTAGLKITEEQKKKISNALRGSKSYWYGKHLPKDVKNKIAAAHKGKHLSSEHKAKISKSGGKNKPWLGKKQPSELVAKRTAKMMGHEVSKETRKKLMIANGTKIICVETGVIFHSICDAARKMGVNQSCISAALIGRQKTSAGYHWEYLI